MKDCRSIVELHNQAKRHIWTDRLILLLLMASYVILALLYWGISGTSENTSAGIIGKQSSWAKIAVVLISVFFFLATCCMVFCRNGHKDSTRGKLGKKRDAWLLSRCPGYIAHYFHR
jgi:hypothetical protein